MKYYKTPDNTLENVSDNLISYLKKNHTIIYPTDSLYGIGAIFTRENFEKIATIKQREMGKKMNIIAPSRKRIHDNFFVTNEDFLKEQFDTHHATTFILQPKPHYSSISAYNESHTDQTIWVRLLKHSFQQIVEQLGEACITTSANISGEPNIKTITDINPRIADQVDIIIDGWTVYGTPSVLIFDESREIVVR